MLAWLFSNPVLLIAGVLAVLSLLTSEWGGSFAKTIAGWFGQSPKVPATKRAEAVAAVETLRRYFGARGSEAEKAAVKTIWNGLLDYDEVTP